MEMIPCSLHFLGTRKSSFSPSAIYKEKRKAIEQEIK
jgi:hypothetical protein